VEWNRPTRSELLQAVDAYLALAYGAAAIPKPVRDRVDAIRQATDETLYAQPPFETDATKAHPHACLRLGNRFYPHMKLIVEPSPAGTGHLFRADTHDQHVRPPPGSREAEMFAQLLNQNLYIAQQIEAAWEKAGVPTFKAYLREDLARRAAMKGHSV
jgi:hypothetical protein